MFKRALEALQVHLHQVGIPDNLRTDANAHAAIRTILLNVDQIVREPDIAGAVETASRDADAANLQALQSIPGIQADKFFSSPSTVDEFRSRNVGLIKDISADLLVDLETTLESPEAVGLTVSALTELLTGRFDVFRSKAEFWAVDQTLKLNADITQSRMVGAGIRRYVWTTANDERVRGRPGGKWADSPGDHWSLEGQIFSFGDDPITNDDGDRNPPGRDYRCRCVAYPLIGKDDEEPAEG